MYAVGVVGFTRARPGGRSVHPGLLGRWVHSRAFWCSLCSSGVVGLTHMRSSCRCVHSVFIRARPGCCTGLLSSLVRNLEVDGFIRDRWVSSLAL